MRARMRLVATLSSLALAAGVLVACGDDDDDDGESTAGPTEVTLIADDAGGNYTFELSETPTAETKSVFFDNQGEEGHFLVYARINEGYTLDEAVELQGKKGSADVLIEKSAGPGKSKTIEITDPIEPGNYAMLCPIPAGQGETHYSLGQKVEFSIE